MASINVEDHRLLVQGSARLPLKVASRAKRHLRNQQQQHQQRIRTTATSSSSSSSSAASSSDRTIGQAAEVTMVAARLLETNLGLIDHQGDNLRMALDDDGEHETQRWDDELELRVGREVRARICGFAAAVAAAASSGINHHLHKQHLHQLHPRSRDTNDKLTSAQLTTTTTTTITTTKGLVAVAAKHRRRRAAEMSVNQVILMTILSFLFLALFTQPHATAALKLPSFLSSWIPQQQQQQTQQVAALAGGDAPLDLSASDQHASLLSATAASNDGDASNAASASAEQLSKANSAPARTPALKRPFGSIGKLPGGHHHLFSTLPKSLFGRILSSGSGSGTTTASSVVVGGGQQQVGSAILSPMTRHQRQQLMLAMMANTNSNNNKYQVANGHGTVLWPFSHQATSPSGNFSKHQPSTSNMHANFVNQQHAMQQQHFAATAPAPRNPIIASLMQHQHDHPITSFRPVAQSGGQQGPVYHDAAHQQQHQQPMPPPPPPQRVNAAHLQQVHNGEQPKKHALGYGEGDDDFIIVNAQQVPELQRPASSQQHHVRPPQGQRQMATPTRHPSEEYREMPAIVIADPDEDLSGYHFSNGNSGNQHRQLNQTAANSTSGEHQDEPQQQQQAPIVGDLVKLKTPTSSSSSSGGINGTIATTASEPAIGDNADIAAQVAVNSSSSDKQQQQQQQQQMSSADDQSSFEVPSSQNVSSSAATDTPESNRQESVASPVILANEPTQQHQHQHQLQEQPQEQEALESFIIGPYKGLTLGDDFASAPSHGIAHMESFIDHQQPAAQFAFPSYTMMQPQQQQQQQQVRQKQHYHSFGVGHSGNLIGSASSLLQQARQLIQLPFTHLPHHSHLHQQHMAPPSGQQQQQQHHMKTAHQPQQQHHWTSMFAQQHQPQPTVYFSGQQQQHALSSMRRPQIMAHHQPSHGHNQNLISAPRPTGNQAGNQPAFFFQGAGSNSPRDLNNPYFPIHKVQPQVQNQGFNLILNHGSQMRPASAYFVDSSQSFQSPGPMINSQQQQQHAPSHSQDYNRQPASAAEMSTVQPLDSNRASKQLARPQQQSQQQPKLKSGLYQIEPPKLASDKIQQQQQQLMSDDDASQQQQKIDVQESAADEELGGGDNSANDDDDNEQQDISNQVQAQEPRIEQQTRQVVAVTEPAADVQQQQQQQQQQQYQVEPIAAVANLSQSAQLTNNFVQAPTQILQVGASFGVAPTAQNSTQNRSQTLVQHERRGQVFNEPIRVQQQQVPPRPDHETTTAFEFNQQQQQLAPPNGYLDTQVYTLPYTMSVQNQIANFVPQPQQHYQQQQQQQQQSRHFAPQRPMQMIQPQQQQQQQVPVTFIRTGDWQDSRTQQLPALQTPPPSWATSGPAVHPMLPQQQQQQGQQFYEQRPQQQQQLQNSVSPIQDMRAYTPAAVAQQTAAQQFSFVVQHPQVGEQATQVPPQLAPMLPLEQPQFQQQQQQVVDASVVTAASQPRQQQQQPQPQESSRDEPITSDSNRLMTTTTTPTSQLVDSPQENGFFAPQQSQQPQQPQQPQQQQQVTPSSRQVARSPSSFCAGRPSGLYADVEQRCKAYYQCAPTGHQMFKCNNQTQFNQKTQNCDWWYNVDCGGHLGSPEDFEQAPSGPRSQHASMEQELVTPTAPSAGAGVPFATTEAGSNQQVALVATATTTQSTGVNVETQSTNSANDNNWQQFQQTQQQQQQQQSSGQQNELRSFVEPPTSSTLAFTTTTTATVNATPANVPNATIFAGQQQEFDQSQATTTTTTTSANSNAEQEPRFSSAAGSRLASEGGQQQQQQQSQDQLTTITSSNSDATTSSVSQQQLIEVAQGESQPRVGSSPNEESATLSGTIAGDAQVTPTTTQAAPTTTTAASEATSQQQQPNQISQTQVQALKTSARRLIQSEFGGGGSSSSSSTSKNARAISPLRKLKQQRQREQPQAAADLISLDAVARSPLDEVSQLHAQEEHHSIRLSGNSLAPESNNQEQQQQIYSTSANQGSISYEPQAVDMLLGQFPPARMGLAAPTTTTTTTTTESARQVDESTVKEPAAAAKGALEKRFGARLTARRP